MIDALVARNPSLVSQRGTVKLTKRAGFWQAFTVSPSLYDSNHREIQYIEGNDNALTSPRSPVTAPAALGATRSAGESTPLLAGGVNGDATASNDGGCCSSCTIQ